MGMLSRLGKAGGQFLQNMDSAGGFAHPAETASLLPLSGAGGGAVGGAVANGIMTLPGEGDPYDAMGDMATGAAMGAGLGMGLGGKRALMALVRALKEQHPDMPDELVLDTAHKLLATKAGDQSVGQFRAEVMSPRRFGSQAQGNPNDIWGHD